MMDVIIQLQEYITTAEESFGKALIWLAILKEGGDAMQGNRNNCDERRTSKRKRSNDRENDSLDLQEILKKRGRFEEHEH